MYCSNCGKEINENSKFCHNCGAKNQVAQEFAEMETNLDDESKVITDVKVEEKSDLDFQTQPAKAKQPAKAVPVKIYKSYTKQVKKIKILHLIELSASILLCLALIFLPIYRIEIESLTKDFSLFDDVIMAIKAIFSGHFSFIGFYAYTFALFEIIFAVSQICMNIPKIIGLVNEIKNIDSTTLLLYNEIQKNGGKQEKVHYFKQQNAYALILYVIFDIIFSKIKAFYWNLRYMSLMTGVSSSIILVIILLVGFIVANTMRKSENKKMTISIAKSDLLELEY